MPLVDGDGSQAAGSDSTATGSGSRILGRGVPASLADPFHPRDGWACPPHHHGYHDTGRKPLGWANTCCLPGTAEIAEPSCLCLRVEPRGSRGEKVENMNRFLLTAAFVCGVVAISHFTAGCARRTTP